MSESRSEAFISFNSQDRDVAQQLNELLESLAISTWFDKVDMQAGLAPGQLANAIAHSDAVVVLVGSHGAGPWQDFEVEAAVALAIQSKKAIIPVLLPGAGKGPLPAVIAPFAHIQFAAALNDPGPLAKLEQMITGAPRGTIRPREVDAILAMLKGATIPDLAAFDRYAVIEEGLTNVSLEIEITEGSAFISLFRKLARLPHRAGQMPSLDYLAACRKELAGLEGLKEHLLNRAIKRVEARLARMPSLPSPAAAAAALPSPTPAVAAVARDRSVVNVLVKVTRDQFSKMGFFLVGWLLEQEVSPGPPFFSLPGRSVPAAALPGQLAALLKTLFTGRPDIEKSRFIHLQVFLPHELLVSPVDQWEVDIGAGMLAACGLRHRVTVRSLERAYDPGYRQTWPEWRAKWDRCLTGVLHTAVHVIQNDMDYSTSVAALLRNQVTALLAFQPPGERAGERLKSAFVGGIPVMILRRATLAAPPTMAQVLNDLPGAPLAWPETILNLRQNAQQAASFWQEATVLLDNPHMLPPEIEHEQQAPLAP